MNTNHKCFQTFLLLNILLLWSSKPVIGQNSDSGDGIRCFENERQALLKFKQDITLIGEDSRLSTWGIEENKKDCCKWRGVQCHNQTNHVTRLDLRDDKSYLALQGMSPSLLELLHLTYLDLSGTSFYVPIPEFIGSFSKLRYLDLSRAGFHGSIPHHIGNLSKLNYLSLEFNYLLYSGDLEWLSHLHDLKYLNLNSVNLSMATNWLQAISKLNSIKELHLKVTKPPEILPSSLPFINISSSTLAVLYLSSNIHISSSTFHWFLNFSSSLNLIDLSFNNMSGTIPDAFDKMISLEYLYLHDNSLEGGIPKSFRNTSSLTHLDLSRNRLNGQLSKLMMNFSSSLTLIDLSSNNISGTIPDASDNMISLEDLDLHDNSLEGGIPKSFGNMSSLTHLDLSRNRLSGQLSKLMMNLSGLTERKLQHLDLSWNKVSGSFPDIAKFSSLKELVLSGGQLNGSIPARYLRLPNLVVLDLSFNSLTGPIPDLSVCTSLEILYLDKNKFSGTLTKSIGGLSKLKYLSLGPNLLQDTITEDHLFNLSQLQMLDLSSNSLLKIKFSHQWIPPFQLEFVSLASCELGPQFPKWIQNQKKLIYLDISSASISDSIPTWFAYLSIKLIFLNASNNQLFGSFPKILFPNFNLTRRLARSTHVSSFGHQTLDLSINNISGSVTFLCDNQYWSFVDLLDNQLSNELPACFANFEYLQYLNLANNKLSGKIPDSFGSTLEFSWLRLRNNSFSGGIPTSLKNYTNLQMIDLGENRLSGKIPSWIGDGFSDLAILSLSSNEFFGGIPSSICGLQTLQILDFSSNNISGPIPKCLSNLTAMTSSSQGGAKYSAFHIFYSRLYFFTSRDPTFDPFIILDGAKFMWKGTEIKYVKNLELVKLVDLSNNNLAGQIPGEITKLEGLIGLNLSRNNFIGSIPQNIGDLTTLDFLDLSRNHLSGRIPTSLSELSHLGILNLSYNNLSGRIPQNSHMLTFGELAYVGNPGLCGRPVLNKSCPGDDETRQHSNFNQKHADDEEDDDDKLISQGFYIAMALGFVIGFWGIFGIILFNKAVRFAFLQVLNRIEDCVCIRVEFRKSRLRKHFRK